MLSFDFNVVGSATDGYQAIDVCETYDPDIVLLDITMPGRDGFQTARDLRQRACRARIVFLTMHDSEEFVAEAFRSGGSGYILKTRLHIDLVSALKRVFAGAVVPPSLRSLFAIDERPARHVAQFYEDDRGLVDEVGAFLHGALRRGDAVSSSARNQSGPASLNDYSAGGTPVSQGNTDGIARTIRRLPHPPSCGTNTLSPITSRTMWPVSSVGV